MGERRVQIPSPKRYQVEGEPNFLYQMKGKKSFSPNLVKEAFGDKVGIFQKVLMNG